MIRPSRAKIQDADYHYQGHEVGRMGDRVDQALEALVGQPVEEEGQDNRCGEAQDDVQEVAGQGVPEQADEVDTAEEVLKILQTDLSLEAAENALGRTEVLKAMIAPVHRAVMEDLVVGHHGRQHQVDVTIAAEIGGHVAAERAEARGRFAASRGAGEVADVGTGGHSVNPSDTAGSVGSDTECRPLRALASHRKTLIDIEIRLR